jgi:predicted TIM-barrel fold metal-dependent hydrolase
MARDGVDVSIVYPAFAVQAYVQPDRELGLACMRSYNDWILGEFQGGAPDHIVGLPMLPVDDGMRACVAEFERCLVAGARGGFLPGFPTRPYHDRYYDPLFARAAEAGLPLSVHRTFGGRPTHANWDAVMGLEFSAGTTVYGFFSAVRTFTYLLYSGVFERHPRLKFVAAEVNFGWLPFWLQSMEQTFEIRTRMGDESIRTTRRPAEYLGENLFVTVLDDKFGFDLVPDHPWLANCALWSSDYPHSVTLWPDSRKHLGELAAGLSDDQVSRIASGNAERVYGV